MATIPKLSLPPLSPAKDIAEYPLFKGHISRWLWRVYAQRLTPAGRWFAVATAVFLAYGGASLQLQGYVVAAYAVALWVVAAAALLLYRPRVRLTAHLAERVCAGETLPIDVEVEQLGRLKGADLVLIPNRLPATIDAVPEDGLPLPDLRRGERGRFRIGVRCHQRGSYVLRGFRVESGFPFGIVRARRTFHEERPLLVYPKFRALARLQLPTGRRYQPGGVALASHIGDSFEYLGNREYRQGDNVRDIDWRATARAPEQRPVVREWVEEYLLRVAVILDTHVPAEQLARNDLERRRREFERAVSVSAAVSDYMARQDYLVDLFAAGPNLYHLTAGRSLAYLDQILDILACVGESDTDPFDVIEPQVAELLGRISTVICVFLDWDEKRRAFVDRLAQQGVGVKVIVACDGQCTLDPTLATNVIGAIAVIDRARFDRGIEEL